MDVRCSRCGVEYEFEDEKVKPTGVTVKCTSCGHVFKVRRPDDGGPPTTPSESRTGWTVRHVDGTVTQFHDMTTLQRWIVEGRLRPEAELAVPGGGWRPLSQIPELVSFFDIVRAARVARPIDGSDAPRAGGAARDTGIHTPPPATLGEGFVLSSADQPYEVTFPAGSLAGLDDDDPVVAWRRRRRRNAAIAVLLVAVAVSAVIFVAVSREPIVMAWLQRAGARIDEATAAPSTDGQSEADAASLHRLVEAALRQTIVLDPLLHEELLATTADSRAEVLALAAGARAEAHRGLVAALRLRLVEALGSLGEGAANVEKAAMRAQLDERLAQTFRLASNARRAGPENADADLALASYQAVKGALPEFRSDLAAARRHAPTATMVIDREGMHLEAMSLLLHARDRERLAEAQRVLQERRSLAPDDARLELAALVGRVLIGERGPSLEAEVSAWRERLPEVWPEGVARLLAPPAVETPAASAPPADEVIPPPQGYDELLRRADTARLREKTRAAMTFYRQASALRPDAVDARVGLGWCHLDLDEPKAALEEFQRALQLDGEHADAHLGVAEASRARRDVRAAVASYRRYLELNPKGRDAAAARAAIHALQRDTP